MRVARRVRRAAWGNGPGATPTPRPRPTQPEKAVVFSFDEKTQCQALDRTQPSLPMMRGRAGTMTHDYKRHGTTDLFAALNIATGQTITACRKRHTAADVLAFFKTIDKAVPRSKDIHVVLDNPVGPQGPRDHRLARPPQASPLAPALHAHLELAAQPRGTVVQGTHRPAAATGNLHQRPRPHRRHRNLDQPPQPRPHALRLARRRRRDPQKSTPRTKHPRTSQITDGPLGRPCRRLEHASAMLAQATPCLVMENPNLPQADWSARRGESHPDIGDLVRPMAKAT